MSKPVIVVFGATGSQGSGAVSALLKQGKFSVRAVTRDPGSDKSTKLASDGAELVKADFFDKDSIVKAVQGAYGVFLVTDYWGAAKLNAELEIEHGKTIIDAAKDAGVQHVVFSSLEDVRRILPKGALPEVAPGGRLIPHWEAKEEIEILLKNSGVPFTILLTSIFMENFLKFYFYPKQEDGSYVLALNAGNKGHPHCATVDIGASAAVAFGDPEKYVGQTVPVVGEHLSFPDAVKTISEVTGKTVNFFSPTRDEAAAFGFPGAGDLANMWEFYDKFTYFADHRPLDKAIVKGQTFQEWAQEHKEELAAKLQ